MGKKYYWLKLPKEFFRQREMKKLRKLPEGELLTLIYLKLLLLTTDKEGYIEYQCNQIFIEELALDIDEDEEAVKRCLDFLYENGLMEDCPNNENRKHFPKVEEMTGFEGKSAPRMRRMRTKKASQSDANVTDKRNNVTIEKEQELEKNKELKKMVQEEVDKYKAIDEERDRDIARQKAERLERLERERRAEDAWKMRDQKQQGFTAIGDVLPGIIPQRAEVEFEEEIPF